MKIIIHDKNVGLTQDDRDYCEHKLSKLERYLHEEPTIVEAHFEKIRAEVDIHITITHPHEKLPDHFDEEGHGVREVVDLVKERIEEHLRRKHER